MLKVELETKVDGFPKFVKQIKSRKSPWLCWQSPYGSITHVAALTGNGVIVASLYSSLDRVEAVRVIKEKEMPLGSREVVMKDGKHSLIVRRK